MQNTDIQHSQMMLGSDLCIKPTWIVLTHQTLKPWTSFLRMYHLSLFLLLVSGLVSRTNATPTPFYDSNYAPSRDIMVHLFEWRWVDIADECEKFLGPMGYAGVQVSPVNENAIIVHPPFKPEIIRPWYERYQPVSYKLVTRSGTEEQFRNMVQRCNAVGVRIYVDAVINHMTRNLPNGTIGTSGSTFDSEQLMYPAVPYGPEDFHQREECPSSDGTIQDYNSKEQVRNCKLEQLNDLDHSKEHVRLEIAKYLNHLIDIGVAGFRIDASKHMWPEDLQAIYTMLNNLSADYFPKGSQPLIYQEVIDLGGEAITSQEYKYMGRVTEFKYGIKLGEIFRRGKLQWLKIFGEERGFLESEKALVFIDNHDNQRGHGAGGEDILTFFEPELYQKAIAFMLAWPYGLKQIISSYRWPKDFQDGKDHNDWVGPPHDNQYNTLPVVIEDGTCRNDWICEHRWPTTSQMVRFSIVSKDQPVTHWWAKEGSENHIAFSRGDKAFFALNNDDSQIMQDVIPTGLPSGQYCDIASGKFSGDTCTGRLVTVDSRRQIYLSLPTTDNSIMALHTEAMFGGPWKTQSNSLPDFQQTVLLVYKKTEPGQDVFIQGGINYERMPECFEEPQKCIIPIKHGEIAHSNFAYQTWSNEDNFLDWNGSESYQGIFDDKPASGTPLAWTTNNPQSEWHNPLNTYGEHYWILNVSMDCSKTETGWFEFKVVMNNGNCEYNIDQDHECSGQTYQAQKPYVSQNHLAMCGKINVFHYGSGNCIIYDFQSS